MVAATVAAARAAASEGVGLSSVLVTRGQMPHQSFTCGLLRALTLTATGLSDPDGTQSPTLSSTSSAAVEATTCSRTARLIADCASYCQIADLYMCYTQ